MQRACDACGTTYEAKRANSRFCPNNNRCRQAYARGARPPAALPTAAPEPTEPPDTRPKVAEKLALEFQQLGVAETYEGAVALGLAGQLDSRSITGTAYVSLSKELDRRVDALRMRAEKPDDPAKAVKERLAEKRLSLVTGTA